ncbi:hypothetical protein F5Y07DRAFT_216352 [Xylaria sp. FL0933]|nr:hypothetical protein F5Y07DRAFT_216352 [Xylaria sp. FL0933]
MPSPTISRTSAEPTLYEILSLTPKRLQGQDSAAQQKAIKQAYHKALLKHHPDKNPQDSPRTSSSSPISSPQSSKEAPSKTQSSKSSSNGKSSSSSKSSSSVPKSQLTYTIDQITHAYSVLSDARQRKEYDRQLLLTSQSHSHSHSSSTFTTSFSTAEQKHSVSTRFHTGVETVDLDDLGFDERSGVYFGSCRCGNARGFQFTEAQLEEYEDDLVLMVQCLDCSLWMRVLFDAAEDDEQPPQQQQSRQQPQQRQQTGNSPSNQTTMTSSNNQTRDAAERRGSHSVSRSGKGWRFNLSFDWGISLSGSASASSSSGR